MYAAQPLAGRSAKWRQNNRTRKGNNNGDIEPAALYDVTLEKFGKNVLPKGHKTSMKRAICYIRSKRCSAALPAMAVASNSHVEIILNPPINAVASSSAVAAGNNSPQNQQRETASSSSNNNPKQPKRKLQAYSKPTSNWCCQH